MILKFNKFHVSLDIHGRLLMLPSPITVSNVSHFQSNTLTITLYFYYKQC